MFLSPAEYQATAVKVSKINARAAKRGFTGRVELTGTLETRTRTTEAGFEVTETGYESEIVGEAPKYNGWTFAARADFLGDAVVLATAPGFTGTIDRSLLVAGHCSHCKINRQRNNTYVLVSDAGEQVQVGSSCIKDFLGQVVNFAFLSTSEVEEEAGWGSFGGGERDYAVLDILAIAWAAIRTYGFVPTSAYGSMNTRNVVTTILHPGKNDTEIVNAVRPLVEESMDHAVEVRDFILSDAFSGDSDYVLNLKAVAAAGFLTWRQLGLIVSAPQALARHQERTLIREREAAVPSTHLGVVGEKITVAGTIRAIRYIEGNYGTTVLYTIKDTDGNVVKWFASREALGDATDVEVKIIGTVKSHSEWNGQAQTTLTRCKSV